MNLKKAQAIADGFLYMIGEPCRKCDGEVYKVLPMPIDEDYSAKMYLEDLINSNFSTDIENIDEQNNGLDFEVYFICKDDTKYCYEPAFHNKLKSKE